MRYVLPFTSSCRNVDFCSGFICNFKNNEIGRQQWNGENILRIWFIIYYLRESALILLKNNESLL
jgi:hypothetical protein